MATLLQLRAQLRQHCVIASTTTVTDGELNDCINAALERIQQARDWKGQEATTGTPIVYGTTTNGVALPPDFITEERVSAVMTQSDPSLALSPIPKVQRGEWIQRAAAQSVSRTFSIPSLSGLYYYLFDEKIFIVPNPSVDTSFVLDYVQNLASLSADGDANFFTTVHPALVKWGALVELYAFLHEDERVVATEAMYQRYFDAARRSDVSAKTGGDAPRTRG